ncbi:hypothetical protein BJ165DRAFT_42275 [Panaeolus papilionaceus]|nr:hypothetical protein BJ165DRAFT_42275 [Panaeolus papilionaceus]
MPPRVTPRIYHLQIKSHKLSIYLGSVPPETKVLKVKEEVLEALQSDSGQNSLDTLAMDPPEVDVQSTKDFELVRHIRDKGKPTGSFEVLSPSKVLREYGLATWELLFIQFRDTESGELLPVTYTLPSVMDESAEEPEEPINKGKRKMGPEDDSDG